MDAAASGQQRFESMASRADALDVEAAELAAKAAALRDVAGRVRLGNEGELVVGAALEAPTAAGWHVLHDRRKSAQSPANLDHVVVGPPGVAVVDAKNWSGGVLRLDERGIKLAGWRKDDALHAAKVDAELVREMARQVVPAVHVVGVLAFVQDVGLTGPRLHRGVVLAQQAQLVPWLSNLPHLLSAQQVDALAQRLDRDLHPRHSPAGTRTAARAPGQPAAPRRPRVAQAGAAKRAATKQQRKRAKARQELTIGMRRLAVLAVFVATLPVTFPVLERYVLTPFAERMSEKLVDSVQLPSPAPSRAAR